MTSPNPIGEGAREIAGKLTPAQRQWLVDGRRPFGGGYWPVRNALCRKGLIHSSGLILPLGEQVRSLLASTQVTK